MTETLKLRGYRADYDTYSVRTRRYDEVHFFDLGVERTPTLPIDDNKEEDWLVSGAQGETIRLNKDQKYFSNYVYVPTHLVQRRRFDVDELELEILEKDSRREGIIWVGKIPGAAEVTELLSQGISPEILATALHPTIPDNKKNMPQFYPGFATVDPEDKDAWEEFYKPFTYGRPVYAGGNCKRANCPICVVR